MIATAKLVSDVVDLSHVEVKSVRGTEALGQLREAAEQRTPFDIVFIARPASSAGATGSATKARPSSSARAANRQRQGCSGGAVSRAARASAARTVRSPSRSTAARPR